MRRIRRLLVVEDQELLADFIAEALEGSFEVLCAHNVEEGLEQLLSAAVDLVLLDCILPGGTMWQVVLEADRQEIPVVLMTGDPSQRKDVAGGERPYILKPFTLQALIDIVEANVPTAAEG
jgi:two-component system, OmpR family, response regulator